MLTTRDGTIRDVEGNGLRSLHCPGNIGGTPATNGQRLQFPLLRVTRRKSVLHYLGSDIRGKSHEELAWGKRADAEIVGSWDAHRWVPTAHVVPPPIDLARYVVAPRPENELVRIAHA